jgi:hypothetical protein
MNAANIQFTVKKERKKSITTNKAFDNTTTTTREREREREREPREKKRDGLRLIRDEKDG